MAKYGKAIVQKIFDLMSSDSYTIAEVCQNVGIDEATFYRWKNEKSEFCETIKRAEESRMAFFVAEAKKSLVKKIQGYSVKEKHTTYQNVKELDKDGNPTNKPRIKEQKVVEKHFQPDTTAIIFTLTNQDPDNWKNKQNTELTGKDGKDLIPARTLTKEEAKELLENIENEY